MTTNNNFNDLNRCYETSQEHRYQQQAAEEERQSYCWNIKQAIEHLHKAIKHIDEIECKAFDNNLIEIRDTIVELRAHLEGIC